MFLQDVVRLLPHATQRSLLCEPDLTVDLRNCGIDVSLRCGPSLAVRVTVAPAVEKLTDTSLVQVKDE